MTTVSILHITTKLVQTPTKQPYRIDLFISQCLYKIITESIKLILDAEQSGASSDLIVLTRDVQKVSFSLLLCILVKTFHGFHTNSIEYFQPKFHHKV